MRCHHITYEGEKIFIPECWASVIHGQWACNCYHNPIGTDPKDEYIRELERENKALYRIIRKSKPAPEGQ